MSAAILTEMTRKAIYLPEIDGLRAIAILLTCLFHFNIAGADSGFLGISIFFVVSGYLVGGTIFRSFYNNDFQISTFWRRRLVRILPALLIVSAIVLLSGYFLLLPEDYVRTASIIRSAILIHANHQIFGIQDYFSPTKYEVHFLHSWSLSVEEQFYLIFPFFAWILITYPRLANILLVSSIVFGFLLYCWGQYNHPFATHYFLVTRAWELLIGVLTFFFINNHPRFTIQIKLLPWLGLTITIGPAFFPQTDSTLISILMHFLVVVGTSIILYCIEANRANSITRLLASRPMRGLGLISYSLYLVHWPLLTFALYYWIDPIPISGRIVLLAASILLAWVSWRWIELPLRRLGNAQAISNRKVFLVSALSAAAVLSAAQLVQQFKGFSGRISERSSVAAAGAQDFSPLRTRCHSNETANPVPPNLSCVIGNIDSNSTLAVWGDSHGVELAYAIAQTGGFPVRQLTSSSCPPLLQLTQPSLVGCAERNDQVLKYLASHREIRTVVLVQHYFGYPEIGYRKWREGINRTVDALRKMDRAVVLIGPMPFPRRNVPSDIARSIMFGRNSDAPSISRIEYNRETSSIIAGLRRISKENEVELVDLTSAMCTDSRCPFSKDGLPLYFDDNHLSLSGARLVAVHILKSTEPLLPKDASEALDR